MSFNTFDELNIPDSMKESLRAMNFMTPTPIQKSAIPAGLLGRNIVGTAQTGTGKTAAFGVPLLVSLHGNPGTQALILAPTRELAQQIHRVLRTIGHSSNLKGTLVIGGESFGRQKRELLEDNDYIVATPGRLNDHLNERTVNLSKVKTLVLDEVDRMLDMGFLPQIKSVLRFLPAERQTMLFSATLPPEVHKFVDPLVQNPVRISLAVEKPSEKITEKIIRLQPQEKTETLLGELRECRGKALIFVRTKSRTHRLVRFLENKGFKASCLHGGRTQAQRKKALEQFRSEKCPIMVATDLAGRGLDISDIDLVINFDVPANREDYIHRIGRTARAGSHGTAISFVISGNHDEERIVTGKSAKTWETHRKSFAANGGENQGKGRSHEPRRPAERRGRRHGISVRQPFLGQTSRRKNRGRKAFRKHSPVSHQSSGR